MARVTIEPGRLRGVVAAPPSKSAQHRAVLLSALARGKSRVRPVARSEDVDATLEAVRALGARWTLSAGQLEVIGIAQSTGLACPQATPIIDCGESGSTLRFLLPAVLAAGTGARFMGRGRLGLRPMEPYEKICREQGIAYERRDSLALDLRVTGRLRPGTFELPGDVSSQFVSGLLMALPLLDGDSTIRLTGAAQSRGYIDLTLEAMRAFGVEARFDGGGTSAGRTFRVPGAARYRACEYKVEGDYSQAAVFLCAAALGHDVRVSGLSASSAQPDQAVLTHLMRMGASVSNQGGLTGVKADALAGTLIDGSQCPDIVPALALTAALARGTTRIVNAARLRLKESDRIAATCASLNALGARAAETGDGMTVEGVARLAGVAKLRGGVTVDCFGDHRIAMLLCVAALHAHAPVTLEGVECLNKSYPDFLKDFTALGGVVHAG